MNPDKEKLNEKLIKACEKVQYYRIKSLVKKGADPNTPNKYGEPAFYQIIEFCNTSSLIKLMLDHGADINYKTEDNITPFLRACEWGCVKTAEILLNAGSNINDFAGTWYGNGLMLAISKRHINMINFLLEKGIDVNACDENGETALMRAVPSGQSDWTFILDILIKNEADVNMKDTNGYTALTNAVLKKNSEAVNILMKNGADPNISSIHAFLLVDELDEEIQDQFRDLLISLGAGLDSFFARYTINMNCKECGRLIPVNGPTQVLKCENCLNENELDDEFWTYIFEETSPEWSMSDTCNVTFQTSAPKCSECDAELNVSKAKLNDEVLICPKCGHHTTNSPAPDWFKKYKRAGLPPQRIICGETQNEVSVDKINDGKAIALQCISCGAAMNVNTETPRNCTCEHCDTVQYLPDPVWDALHPMKKRKVWYIYYSK